MSRDRLALGRVEAIEKEICRPAGVGSHRGPGEVLRWIHEDSREKGTRPAF
jgi:hypothetical protein